VKLYLRNEAAGYSPATFQGTWDDTSAFVTRAMDVASLDAGADVQVSKAETSTSNPYRVGLVRLVSAPLAAQTISGWVNLLAATGESNVAADMFYQVHIYATQGDTDTPRGTLLSNYAESSTNEWTTPDTTTTGLALQGNQTLSSLAVSAGDRLVVELGYAARNTSATSRTGAMAYGGGPQPLLAGQGYTTGIGYIELENDLAFVAETARVSQEVVEYLDTSSAASARVSQEVIEYLDTSAAATARLSQEVIEYLSPPGGELARMSQILIEYLRSDMGEFPALTAFG